MSRLHQTGSSNWLQQYGNVEDYRWRRSRINGAEAYSRPIGLVEASFDADGRYYEGRADMNCELELAVKNELDRNEFRERVLLSWNLLRQRHLLLQSRTFQDRKSGTYTVSPSGMHFAVPLHDSPSRAIEDAGKHLVFVGDHYETIDHCDFYLHCLNGSRILDPSQALAKLFVLPPSQEPGRQVLRLVFIFGHEISDGLSAYSWMKDLIRILNEPLDKLKAETKETIRPQALRKRLPPPQEALYPSIPGSKARQRWFWAITRLLRHVRKPLPVGFDNPLRRRLTRGPVSFSPVYDKVLDYTRTPPLNTVPVDIHLGVANVQRLHRICREAKSSIGAGVYALAALCMMEFYEEREPHVALEDRKCFITGFPLDPRAFFGKRPKADSMMLAFSDGIALPFLCSKLPVEGRLRLLARHAQRQLSAYQKRAKPKGEDATRQFLSSRGAGLVLANQYLYSHERADSILPESMRKGINLQGAYPPRPNPTSQTCGVSSIGNRDLLIRSGIYDIHNPEKDFAADFLNMKATVRARDNEFLLGISGTKEGLFSSPSIDMTSMDPVLVERWKDRFEHALDESEDCNEKSRL
ncbi:hypothetical protein AC579_8914 [Pseudocercospora musae]|uniref:Condensation domain-containing protein n=1 Tax=Pseudocercospora musae TaxID=113226 RepID=A0A139ID94_9PEZI|nr:hypothetical protein AC579_8914 [Pseudocercospora musae]